MSNDPSDPGGTDLPPEGEAAGSGGENGNGDSRLRELAIEDELRDSYLTYAMSVIVSRALPDVRDGLKPSQRRILVAMNDLNLSPGASRVKCAKISGDTSGNYHPHGESVIYPTLVRMAQDWNMRYVLVDKQGNFGSIAGLPPAAMRYTEARLSHYAALLLDDLKLDTVDFLPTYDERRTEPVVLPSKLPNLLVNGANGIAVGMATSIPPHNLGEVCDALVRLIDEPGTSIDELMEIIPGPDFPTGGEIQGVSGIRRGYYTGRSTLVLRARAEIEEYKKDRFRIIVTEIPYQQVRDRVIEKIAALANMDKIKGISAVHDYSDLKQPVRIVIELKSKTDPHVVLNQLYQYSPLQDTISIILLALVDGKPRTLNLKELLDEFLRHRVAVIRRRTEHLLVKARARRHTVEGLLLAFANIDEVIQTIRTSKTQAEAKERLMGIEAPASMLRAALGDEGFREFQLERGESDTYSLTPVQADAILRMTLGHLVNLEQEKLGNEFNALLEEINEYVRILSDEANILAIIREDCVELKRKHGDKRRTAISGEEYGRIDMEELITEETMVVTLSHSGYIKRTPASQYRAQRRGGKGLIGARTDEEDPIEHLFVASTHAYLLFFTTFGKVHWQKVYDLPALARDSRGRALVNLLNLAEGEQIADCRAVREFTPDTFLIMATRKGLVKKTELKAYSRPMKGGIIAIKLKEDDELVDVAVVSAGDEIVLSTAHGMAIRFNESDARPMGRNTSGVKGVRLSKGDHLVGMVVADEHATLLTACAHGYGKRTPFGPSTLQEADDAGDTENGDNGNGDDETSSSQRYRTQGRGGKGVRDIKTTDRNGPVVSVVAVQDDDEVMMISGRGKIQRIAVSDISVIGRNTQGVRIMGLDEEDTLTAVVRVPRDDTSDNESAEPAAGASDESSPAKSAENSAKDNNAESSEDSGDDEAQAGDNEE